MIKRLLFVLTLASIVNFTMAQKAEISAGISGNLSNYGGTAATSDGSYNTQMVFSKRLTGGYGANAQIKYVAKGGFMIGAQGGYDELRSTADIKSIIVYNNCISCALGLSIAPTTGSVYGYVTNTTKFVNFNPFLGYRVKKSKLSIDFNLGINLAFVAEDKNRMVYTEYYQSDNTTYFDRSKQYTPISKTDVRIKTGVAFGYRRFGLALDYEHGLNNLVEPQKNTTAYYPTSSAFSQVLRLGLNYRIF